MGFLELEMPTQLSFGATGGRGFFTTKNPGFSGFRQYNRNWTYPLAQWEVTVRSQKSADTAELTDYDTFRNFFLNVYGMGDGFRFKDWNDFTATNETIAVADGSTAVFQLVKTYSIYGRSFVIPIKKPIMSTVRDYLGNALEDTVLVYDNGVLNGSVTVDATTGLATFPSNVTVGHIVSWSGEFHFPVHFGTDRWQGQVEPSWVTGDQTIISMAQMPLEEVRIP